MIPFPAPDPNVFSTPLPLAFGYVDMPLVGGLSAVCKATNAGHKVTLHKQLLSFTVIGISIVWSVSITAVDGKVSYEMCRA